LEDGEKSERAGEGDREAERDVARNEIEIEEDPEGPQVADGGDEAEEGECVVGQAVECVGAAGVGNGKRLPQQRKLSDECTNRRHRSENQRSHGRFPLPFLVDPSEVRRTIREHPDAVPAGNGCHLDGGGEQAIEEQREPS